MAEQTVRPVPQNAILMAIANALRRADEGARSPGMKAFSPLQALALSAGSQLMGVPATARTLERAAGGFPLTSGSGWATNMLPDTAETVFAAPGLISGTGALGRIAGRGTLAGMNAMMEGAATAGSIPRRSLQQAGAIKPKGGNWLAGDVEKFVAPLKAGADAQEIIALRRANPEMGNAVVRRLATSPENTAANDWIDKQLTRYIKSEMATPEDPVRLLADKGILHVGEEAMPRGLNPNASLNRTLAEMPIEGFGQGPLGTGWEALTDNSIRPYRADQFVGFDGMPTVDEVANPWLTKVAPETSVMKINSGMTQRDLGLNHLMDELRNAMNPASGLPPELLLKYSSLDKVSVPQAVERVHKINEWRAAQQAEANKALANNAATFTHKEYPEAGFKWVELKQPKETGKKIESSLALPEDMGAAELLPDDIYDALTTRATVEGERRGLKDEALIEFVYDEIADGAALWAKENGKVNVDESIKQLRDALKYEGDTMGHCVGGYCEDVAEGNSRIYSLRDAKGQPHVTIEIKPGKQLRETDLGDDVRDWLADSYGDAPQAEFEAAVQRYLKEGSVPDEIIQVKGKGNKAPKEDYLPFVQDFVRSQKWGRVGDLQNTGLVRKADLTPAEAASVPHDYLTIDEVRQLRSGKPWSPMSASRSMGDLDQAPQRFKVGGLVSADSFTDYDPLTVDSLAEQLSEELNGQ